MTKEPFGGSLDRSRIVAPLRDAAHDDSGGRARGHRLQLDRSDLYRLPEPNLPNGYRERIWDGSSKVGP
jgi:hypothetical protein